MNQRAYALDALRGYAIITMVLSATIASKILPPWMYHMQTPPPTHEFNPNLPGLTWVDLVFPFFLFAMGAAFPFSVGKKFQAGVSKLKLCWDALKRGLQLTFFAIFIEHFYPYMLSSPQDARSWLLAICAFMLLFPMFMRIPLKMPEWMHTAIKITAFALAFLLMISVEHVGGQSWSLYTSNIIILLLANMAFFATVVYIFTMQNRWNRIAVLVVLLAIQLSAGIKGSWAGALFNFSPFPWMYKFTFLKYLFIVIPGSIAGEYLMEWMNQRKVENNLPVCNKQLPLLLLALTITLVVSNLYFLYNRMLEINLAVSVLLLASGILLLKDAQGHYPVLWKKLFNTGAYLLILGLCFEAFDGGIKKDPATYSYYFVTSGLAFMSLLALNVLCDFYALHKSTAFLVQSGQNPMIAYVAGDLLIMPVLRLAGITPLLTVFNANIYLGFLRGVLLTSVAVLITMFFTRIKWFWRT